MSESAQNSGQNADASGEHLVGAPLPPRPSSRQRALSYAFRVAFVLVAVGLGVTCGGR